MLTCKFFILCHRIMFTSKLLSAAKIYLDQSSLRSPVQFKMQSVITNIVYVIITFESFHESSRKYCVITNTIYVITNFESFHESSRKDCYRKTIYESLIESFYKSSTKWSEEWISNLILWLKFCGWSQHCKCSFENFSRSFPLKNRIGLKFDISYGQCMCHC